MQTPDTETNIMADVGLEEIQDISLAPSMSNDGNQLPDVEDMKTEQAINGGGTRGKRNILLAAIGTVAVIIAIILIATLGRKDSSSKSSSSTGNANTNKLTGLGEALFLIKNVYGGSEAVFQNPVSPQSKALEWILGKDNIQTPKPKADSDPTNHAYDPFVQRYAVAAFIFSTMPQSVVVELNLLDPDSSECTWNAKYKDRFMPDGKDRPREPQRLGFICDDGKRMIQVRFPSMGLFGYLPVPELEAMKYMEKIELDVNKLSLENELPIFAELSHLSMAYNFVAGTLPSTIGGLTNLRVLSLSNNNIKGVIPPEINKCRVLEVLAMDHNSLLGGLSAIEDLRLLEEIYLGNNFLEDNINHSTFDKLKNLEVLSLHNNELAGPLPNAWFTELKALKHLDVHHNTIGSTEEWNNEATRNYDGVLEYIDVKSNVLRGELPRSLHFLSSHLTHLDVSHNSLDSKIPTTLQSLVELRALMLSKMGFGDSYPAPDWLASLTELKYLSLQSLGITGTIPSYFADMDKLILLDLDFNRFSKEIPTVLSTLPELKYLQINRNQLTGNVPPEIVNMPSLTLLTVDNNMLNGTLGPATDANCPISVMTADCGNEAFNCPFCEGQAAIDAQQEISCPCCSQCCYDSPDDEDCNLGDWLSLVENDSEQWRDVRYRRQEEGINTEGYLYYHRSSNYERISS